MMGNSAAISKGKNKTVFVLALCYFFVFGLSNVNYFLSVYYAKLGTVTPREAGLIVSIFYIVSVVSRPFLAFVLSRLGFRRLFAAAAVLFIASSVSMALWGTSFWPALASRGVLGFASSLYKIGFSTYQALTFDASQRGRAYSLIMAGELFPLWTVAPAAEALIQWNRLALYISVPVFMSIAASAAVWLIPNLPAVTAESEARPTFVNPFLGMSDCLRRRPFQIALLSTFFFSMTDASASFMAPMTAHYGLMASLFLSSNALVGFVIRLFFTRHIDRLPRGLVAAAAVLFTSGALFAASINPTEASLTVLGLLFGVGFGFGFPIHLAFVADSAPKDRQAQASAMMWFLIGLNFSVVPLLMGWFQSQLGPVLTFRALALLSLAGACVLFLLQLPAKPDRGALPHAR